MEKSNRFPTLLQDVLPVEKNGFTQHKKQVLVQKIQESRISNLKKSFVGKDGSKGMIFATVGLIVIVLFWLLLIISQRFDLY